MARKHTLRLMFLDEIMKRCIYNHEYIISSTKLAFRVLELFISQITSLYLIVIPKNVSALYIFLCACTLWWLNGVHWLHEIIYSIYLIYYNLAIILRNTSTLIDACILYVWDGYIFSIGKYICAHYLSFLILRYIM